MTRRKYPFTEPYVTQSPEDRGMYWLWRDARLLYVGIASGESTIRARLCDHFYGRTAPSGREATHYAWKILSAGRLRDLEFTP